MCQTTPRLSGTEQPFYSLQILWGGQELRGLGIACLCSIISGASAGRLDTWGWNYLEAGGAGCRLSHLELLGRTPRWDLSMWSGLPPSMAAQGSKSKWFHKKGRHRVAFSDAPLEVMPHSFGYK